MNEYPDYTKNIERYASPRFPLTSPTAAMLAVIVVPIFTNTIAPISRRSIPDLPLPVLKPFAWMIAVSM